METPAHARLAKALSGALRDHDPNLSLVWVKSNIPSWEIPENVIPGRWHVKQDVRPTPRYYAITTPDGGYREPDFGVLRELQERDTRNLSTHQMQERFGTKEKDPGAKTLADEQRLDELKADFRAAKRVAAEDVFKRRWGRGGVVGS